MDVVVLLVGLAVLVGLVGVVVPVLPGSLLIGLAVLVWAAVRGGGAWCVFAAVAVLLTLGSAGSYLVTGRRVLASGVPQRTLVLAGLAGIVGFVLLPGVGLLIAFPGALFGLEYLRVRNVTVARTSAWLALKATGLGMLVELALALLAATTWVLAVAFGAGL